MNIIHFMKHIFYELFYNQQSLRKNSFDIKIHALIIIIILYHYHIVRFNDCTNLSHDDNMYYHHRTQLGI